ncbi:hypothetical protein JTE90_016124 [Oedothorax gibbosus]|uniref:G-protein coupled receptors family 2 profile 2 domain-containing protein n=1 Tax=Oedothorax gibbosus TaxID=931172 RepID=A0AAV6U699_9ARAC|nr:hypothetical protein JTE90_016124 [Oedothorax gibbosus]
MRSLYVLSFLVVTLTLTLALTEPEIRVTESDTDEPALETDTDESALKNTTDEPARESDTAEPAGESDTKSTTDEPALENATDEFELDCDSQFILEPDEFVANADGTVFIPTYGLTINSKSYIWDTNGSIAICPPTGHADGNSTSETLTFEPLQLVSKIGVSVSMVCLLVHLLVFAVVREHRNLPDYNLATLCLSLFFSYLSLMVSRSDISGHATLCVTFAAMTQFFFLASFLWMFAISFDVFRSIILATGSLRTTSKRFQIKKYLCQSSVCWLPPLLFSVAAVLADNLPDVPDNFVPGFHRHCWFDRKHALLVFFAGPVFAVIVLNFLLFAGSSYAIYSNRLKSSTDSGSKTIKESQAMYLRLAVIMGITWITGILAAWVHQTWLWYVFALLNTLQGFFILVAFTCTGKVKKFIKVKLFGVRRQSEPNLTPTFQSYCAYTNSLDKDLEKVGEGRVKSASIDTIAVHI